MSSWIVVLGVVTALVGVFVAPLAVARFRIARQRASIRSVFKQYVSPDVVDELVRAPAKELPAPVPRTVSFVVLQLRDEEAEDVQKQLARALPIVSDADGWIVEHVAASLVIATCGAIQFKTEGSIAEDHNLLASRLMTELGSEIRLVHGSAAGLVGNFGGGTRMSFGTVWPNFGQILERLVRLEFGQSAEIMAVLT